MHQGMGPKVAKKEKNIRQGQILKNLRKSAKLTQGQLAQLVGMKPQQISNYESGIRGIGDVAMDHFARAFGITESELRRMLLGEPIDSFRNLWMELNQVDIAAI
jgi:transcriptional regulator with XRE-family HTH domain